MTNVNSTIRRKLRRSPEAAFIVDEFSAFCIVRINTAKVI
jgi:hypothetical protein